MARDSQNRKARAASSSVAGALQTGVAVLPLGIGLGITGKNVLKNRGTFSGVFSHQPSVSDAITSRIRGLKPDLFPPMADRLNRMNFERIKPHHVASSFNQAVNTIPDMTQREALRKKFRSFAGSSRDMADYGEQLLTSNSLYTHSAKSRFLHNLGGFHKSLDLGFNPEFGAATSYIGSTGNPVNLSKQFPDIYKHLAEFEEATGSVISATQYTRPGVEGSVLKLKFSGGGYFPEGGDFHLNMPLSIGDTGMVTSGLTLKNQNITGAFAIVDLNNQTVKSTLKYEEVMALRMKGKLVSQLNALGIGGKAHPRDISRVLRNFADEQRQAFENVPSFLSGMGDNPYTLNRARAAGLRTLLDTSGERITGDRLLTLLQKMPEMAFPTAEGGVMRLWPTSPNRVLGGTFTTMNPANAFAFPEMVAASRRPDQAYRPFVPTAEARSLIANDPLTQRFQFLAGERAGESPAMWTMYSNNVRGKPGLSLGENLVSSSMRPMMATETIHSIPLAYTDISGRLFGKNAELQYDPKTGRATGNVGVKAGEFLGYDTEGGAIFAHQDMDILGGLAHENEIALTARLRSPTEQFSRVRHGTKGMREYLNEDRLQGAARGVLENPDFAEHIQAIISMDELRKNRNLHHQQMFSALVEYTEKNMGAQASTGLLKHYDPIRQAFVGAGDVTTTAGIDYIAQLAHGSHLSPEQAGGVFGGIPLEQLGSFYERNNIPESWKPHIEMGAPRGIAFQFAGGPHALYGAGTAMGSIEPRVLGTIKGGAFGSLGDELFEDLARNRVMTSPEVKMAQGEIYKTMESLNPATSVASSTGIPLSGISEAYFRAENPNYIFGTGGTINFGGVGGLQDVYVPSGESTKHLSSFRTKEGQIVRGDVAHGYENFIRSAQRAANEPEFAKAFGDIHASFNDLMRRTAAATVTGEGGLARGKISGSSVLDAINRYNGENEDIRRIGLSAEDFSRMAGQMSDIGLNTEEMSKRFFQGGEVGGLLIRHPDIGPYSAQAVRYYHDRALAESVAHTPVVKRKIYIDGQVHEYDWSVTKGLAADFDGDTFHAVLGHPELEGKLRNLAQPGSAYSQEYENFAMRSGFFKPSTASEAGTSISALLKGDTIKSALTEKIGLLSYTMTRAKEGLRQVGPQEGREDAGMLLELFEQHGISAKKFSSAQAAQGATLLGDLTNAFQSASAPAIRQSAEEIFGTDSLAAKMLSGKEVPYTLPGGGGGVIKTLNLDKAALALQRAEEHMKTKVGKISPEVDFSMVQGHKELGRLASAADNPNFFAAMSEGLLGPFASEGFSRGAGINAVRETLTTANKFKAIGEDILHANKKPLLWGFGTSLALGAILSAPRASLDSTPVAIPSMGSSTGESASPENTMPSSVGMGQPLPPRMASNPAPVDMGRVPMSGRMTVHTRSHGHFDPDTMGSQVRNVMGNRTHVRTTVNDNRRNLTAQKLSDIMDR